MTARLTEGKQEALDRGQAAHPRLQPDRTALLELWSSLELPEALDDEQAAELYLVCAALVGEPEATRDVQRRIRSAVRVIEGVDPDDIVQRCWIRLFSSEHRILRYAGRGSLDALFRVTTTRLALNAVRDAPNEASLETAYAEAQAQAGPEELLATTQYQRAFKDGLEHAISGLSDEHRLLLRLHLVDRLSIDELSSMLGVHRATAARRLQRARGHVADGVRAALREALGEAGVEDSLLRQVRSQLDLSLSRILK